MELSFVNSKGVSQFQMRMPYGKAQAYRREADNIVDSGGANITLLLASGYDRAALGAEFLNNHACLISDDKSVS